MVCIYCGADTEVYNSRPKARQPLVWRRRRCLNCVAQFTTHELPEYATALIVSRGKILSPFERDKLFLSIYRACGHRNDSQTAAANLTNTVLGKIARNKLALGGKLEIRQLAVLVHITIKRFDPLAASTYKAYHQEWLD